MESLKSGPSLLIQAETSSGEFSAVGGPQKFFFINLRPLSAAIGAGCKGSWSQVELGRHFILITGVSALQDQTSDSLAS